jgi:tetratricopeptide (TPR) repeat protein
MQNLTSRYNILYNANELLKESEQVLQESYPDDYSQLLTVYKEPNSDFAKAELKNLDSITSKANTIISEKAQSQYVKDAYMLVGKINYLKTNYFNAAEFFNYNYITYPDDDELRQQSLVWKARSLMQLNRLDEASVALDSALKHVETAKKVAADVYATEAQFNIKTGNEANAIEVLQKALKAGTSKANELRWTYLLAQLQERNDKLPEAYANYTAVVKSNAPFEMAFNANVNRIAIANGGSNSVETRISQLKALLKEDKNKDFLDQIYYRLGDIYMGQGERDKAIEQYNMALRLSTKNANQKGLTYLRLADLNFREANYVKAKAYYDSTLTTLSPGFPEYENIRLKASNLDLLANRYQIIANEDTLQSLARLPETEREVRIGELVREQVRKASGQSPTTPDTFIAGIDVASKGTTDGKFYFNNTVALSQGFIDFKRRWGNRKLEDNWRRSSKSAAESVIMAGTDPDAAGSGVGQPGTDVNADALSKSYHDNLPLTPLQFQQSTEKIISAYYDIAGFYKDDLRDNAEAVKIYQKLLADYPENTYVPAINYNLYRIYSESDKAKSDEFKNIVITRFPESTYAKVLLDPHFGDKADEKSAAAAEAYNQAYLLYEQKKYNDVIAAVTQSEARFGKNAFSPQFAYLNSLAIGRTQKLDAFEQSLNQLVAAYPDDRLVTPLVKQHLEFISANRDALAKRPVALIDFDPNEPRFVSEPTADKKQPIASQKPSASVAVNDPDAGSSVPASPVASGTNDPDKAPQNPSVSTPPANNSMFSLPDSAEYYFVVNVQDPGANLSSSRFGIGQFNRANFPQGQIKHQLKEVNSQNQLIFVGSFHSLNVAKEYERNIVPLMSSIMKVPAAKYNTFVITKADLDKLASRERIEMYIDFYRQH